MIALALLSTSSLNNLFQKPYAVSTVDFLDTKDSKHEARSVPMRAMFPAEGHHFPLIIFSHGAGGSVDANYAQAYDLATHGYTVVCVEHVGSNFPAWKKAGLSRKGLQKLTHDAIEVRERPKDVSFAIDKALEWSKSNTRLKNKVDPQKIGVIGHSFGAFTTLVVCGARPALDWLKPLQGEGLGPSQRDQRVKCGVALSAQGPGEPFFLATSYRTLAVPMLGISGTKDEQQGSEPDNHLTGFKLWPKGDKFFLWLTNADHLAFSDPTGSKSRGLRSDTRQDVQPISRELTTIFFDTYLKKNNRMSEITPEWVKKRCTGTIPSGEFFKR
jgi:predicted dienelactone hydrolase